MLEVVLAFEDTHRLVDRDAALDHRRIRRRRQHPAGGADVDQERPELVADPEAALAAPDHRLRVEVGAGQEARPGFAPDQREACKATSRPCRYVSLILSGFSFGVKSRKVSEKQDLSVPEYQNWLSEVRGLTLGSLENAGTEEEGCDLLRYLADKDEHWPSQIVERAELESYLKGIRYAVNGGNSK